ncbi:MAG: hypothetical protein HZB92_08315 [Euryarchaeota archaeon]|nr:hypothetical protein [Euryarchaeota archaeon]
MKVRGSFLGTVSGRFGDMVFYESRGQQIVRIYRKPRNPRTKKQTRQRKAFADAVHGWKELSGSARAGYERRAMSRGCSGMNLYVKERTGRK